MIIGTCGFSWSGSSAVQDFLKEFEEIEVYDRIEFILAFHPDGLEDLDDFSLEVVPGNSGVSLGDFNMKAGAKLEEGTIIELNKLAGEPVDLFDKKTGKIFAKGEVVVIDENFGVRVTEVLEK